MKICPACLFENNDSSQFCARCGQDIRTYAQDCPSNSPKEKSAFWWIPAGLFAGCALLTACIIFFSNSTNTSAIEKAWQPELPNVEVVDYTPNPSATNVPAEEVLPAPTVSPLKTPEQTEASDDLFLYNLIQGMWVSETDFEGCCSRLLIHGNVAALSVANPLTDNAEPRMWEEGDWDSDIWNWGNCHVDDGVLYVRDQVEEIPFRIYPVSDYELELEFNYSDFQEGDRVTFYRIQAPKEFTLTSFLEGDWISDGAIPSDATIHGLYKFYRDGSGEIGRAKENSNADTYDYERVFSIVYSTHEMLLTFTDQNNTVSEYSVAIEDAFTITFGDETFRRLG